MSTDSNLPVSSNSARTLRLVLLFLVYITIFSFGGYWVRFLLLGDQTVFDKADPWAVSNYSLLAAFLVFVYSRPVLVRKKGAWKGAKIILVECGLPLTVYVLMTVAVGPWFLETKILRAGEKYHVAFVDGNGYQIRGDSVYPLPVHSEKRGNQISTQIQYGSPPIVSSVTDIEAQSVWTLGVVNRLAQEFSDFKVRVDLDTVVLSYVGEGQLPPSMRTASWIPALAARHENDNLNSLIYTPAEPLTTTPFVDVPFHSVALMDFRTLQSNEGQKVKHVGDFVEFEMELVYQPSGEVTEPAELQIIDYRRSYE